LSGTPEAEAVLSIGLMAGGSGADVRRWRDGIMALARRVKSLRQGMESPLNVNVVYQVPGEVLQELAFAGVRTGRYSTGRRLLLVQVAVPTEPPANMDDFLLDMLQTAVEEAERFALRRGLTEEPLVQLRDILRTLRTP